MARGAGEYRDHVNETGNLGWRQTRCGGSVTDLPRKVASPTGHRLEVRVDGAGMREANCHGRHRTEAGLLGQSGIVGGAIADLA